MRSFPFPFAHPVSHPDTRSPAIARFSEKGTLLGADILMSRAPKSLRFKNFGRMFRYKYNNYLKPGGKYLAITFTTIMDAPIHPHFGIEPTANHVQRVCFTNN